MFLQNVGNSQLNDITCLMTAIQTVHFAMSFYDTMLTANDVTYIYAQNIADVNVSAAVVREKVPPSFVILPSLFPIIC
jgi:hypothetical protein